MRCSNDFIKSLNMPLERSERWLVWNYSPGKGWLGWAPHWVREAVVKCWNLTACALFGHFSLLLSDDGNRTRGRCPMCQRMVKASPSRSVVDLTDEEIFL